MRVVLDNLEDGCHKRLLNGAEAINLRAWYKPEKCCAVLTAVLADAQVHSTDHVELC